ncbi:MAG: response regulator [Spirochaetales bacterium]|nr:response regulator [Spirochaetales bacterium]
MRSILIVDDDRDLLEGQKIFLEGKGYRVETAASIEDGLKKIETFTPDIILADLMMEHYDSGFVFCKKVRDREHLKDVPIIMQTAASKEIGFTLDAASPEAKKWMKVNEVLTKPVPLHDLLGKIEHYIK